MRRHRCQLLVSTCTLLPLYTHVHMKMLAKLRVDNFFEKESYIVKSGHEPTMWAKTLLALTS